ncbi:MAG: M23 family metallopeptidase [Bradymonadales bacterium]|nr:M23 family metallopeptidase [Bradymonadales bacterium]
MKVYQPIASLRSGKRRWRKSPYTLGILGILVLGLTIYWIVAASRDNTAQARTDRIIALSSPDFTEILSGTGEGSGIGQEALREGLALVDPSAVSRPFWAEGIIRPNQTLFVAMRNAGVDPGSIQSVVDSFQGILDFRRCRPGDSWESDLDEESHIVRFRYTVSPEEVYEANQQPDGTYQSARLHIPTEVVIWATGGTVITSVHEALSQAGEASGLSSRFLEVFGWDIDFSKEARPGDRFRLIVEKIYLDGEFLRYGRLLAAEYEGQSNHLTAYAYTDEQGRTEYFTAEGESLRRNFLRAPLHYRRISSPFSWRRFHPVLRRYRPHLGVDYAAPTGTPIWAIADGRISFVGSRGGNGNLVVIQHDRGYESIYAHLSRFASGMRPGRTVRQGEVIGFVGNTGVSTGPHLHFGMRRHGEYFDPLSVESQRARRLEGDSLIELQQTVAWANQQLNAVAITPVNPELLVWPEESEQEEETGAYGLVEGFIDDVVTGQTSE